MGLTGLLGWAVVVIACMSQAHARRLLQNGATCSSLYTWNASVCALATGEYYYSTIPVQTGGTGGAVSGGSIGFTTGGAYDVENFRANLDASYLPIPSDVTFNGIIKDYYFDTTSNATQPCTELFCPLYSLGLSPEPALVQAADGPDPRGNTTDVFMAVGLDSGIQASEFKRKNLNLVLLLDVSGSMDSPFDSYYYDQFGNQQNLTDAEQRTTKITVAKEVLTGILDLLTPEDRVSIVLFSDDACTPLPLGKVSCMDLQAIKAGIENDVVATYSTNTYAGLELSIKTLEECGECMSADPEQWENRIILMTDAQTNDGNVSDEDLKKLLGGAGSKGIYITIVGIGLDFQTTLVDIITQISGANYLSVHSPGEFQKRLVSQFEYIVTPLVFDLSLEVKVPGGLPNGDGWRILQVYGTSNNDTTLSQDGKILNASFVKTLFPSPKEDTAIKGGVVLVRLLAPSSTAVPLQLVASYKDRNAFVSGGAAATNSRTVSATDVAASNGPTYQSSGVRKAILLARYTDLLRSWLVDQWEVVDNSTGPVPIPGTLCPDFPTLFCPEAELAPLDFVASLPGNGDLCGLTRWVAPRACILPVPDIIITDHLGEWERQSSPLKVSREARAAFEDFLPYFQAEAAALGDASLDKEVEVLKKIIAAPTS